MRFGGLIAAIIFAAIAAVIVLRMSGGDDTPAGTTTTVAAAPVNAVNIYVAAQPIPIGGTITEEMITTQPWPEHLLLDGFIKADGQTNVTGMIARAPFQTQEPLLSSKIANAQDPNFLAGSIPKGMRALTIQTNEVEGMAGFLFPGDRVDILLTRDVEKWVQTPGGGNLRKVTDSVSESLLTNVTILAVDQRSTAAGATDEKGNLVTPRSATLMVSPKDAQRLLLGARKGVLSMSLRSLEDRESSDPLIITGISDISQFPESAGSGVAGSVMVVRGTNTERLNSDAPAVMPGALIPTMPPRVTP